MTYALEGVQFRSKKAELSSWDKWNDNYEEWQAVPKPGITQQVFSSGTQFRMAPIIHYQVIDEKDKITDGFLSKTDAMALVSKLIDQGQTAMIKSLDKTPDLVQTLFNKNVQYSTAGSDSWRSITYLNPTNVTDRVTFRIRPDYHFQVIFSNSMQSANVQFDDAEKLAKYVDNKIRTGHYDFTVRAIKYGI